MDNQSVPPEDYDKPLGGKERAPLPLLPDREWLGARIINVELRICMFNNQIQYLCRKEFDEEQQKEVDIPIIDDDSGEKIPRKEFNIKFQLHDYTLPDAKISTQRNVWVTIGAAMGDRAHLPTFLFNVVGPDFKPGTPNDVVNALKGVEVKLQLANKPNKKDPTKPPYQNVLYDAVMRLEKQPGTEAPEPVKTEQVEPPVEQVANAGNPEHCDCPSDKAKGDANNHCLTCGKLIIAWDE